jgi:F-type H+-transporting ATPase subunit epsilon
VTSEKIKVSIITPEKEAFAGEAEGITLPTEMGEITILSNHEPLIALIRSGEIALHLGSERRHMAIHGGFIEVSNNRVRLVTDAAELAEEIDERRAQQALERAKRAKTQAQDAVATADALAAMERALSRLRIAERRKQRHRA